MKNYIYLSYVLIIITSFSSCARINKLGVKTKKEQIFVEVYLLESKIKGPKSVVNQLRPWFEEVCRRDNIEQESEYLSDSTVVFKLMIPDFESANRLALNFENIFATNGHKGELRFKFIESKKKYSIKMDICSGIFTDEGMLFVQTDDAKITPYPLVNNDYCQVGWVTQNQVKYTLINQKLSLWASDCSNFNSFKIDYSNPDYFDESVPEPGPSLKPNPNAKPNVSYISMLFEEHFWATMSAITGTIVSLVTILNYFKKK